MRAYLAVLVAGLVLVHARPADAIPYETFIDIDDESDLEDLLSAQDITQDTYDELLDLLGQGVDLNTADRAELYSLPNLTYDEVDKIIAFRGLNQGTVRDPADLVAAGAISQEKLLAISSFLILTEKKKTPYGLHGWARLVTRWAPTDKLAPPGFIRARVFANHHLEAGIAMTTTRLKIGETVYDPNREALISENRSYQFHVPRAFLKWETDQYTVIGGSYRAGFGQRLVFTNSAQYTPNGLYTDDLLYYSGDLDLDCRESAGELGASPCAGAAGSKYDTPDFIWRTNGLFGVGAGVKKLNIGGTGWVQAYAWASAARRSIYQYELVDRAKCEDPHKDTDPACAAPTVYVEPNGDILTPTARYAFQTIPDVFGEKLAGTNLTYFADRRNSVGATVYGATETNLISGIDLDTQEWSRLPTGRRFGAAGANFAFGRQWLDVFGEAAYSYDKLPNSGIVNGGGGPAAILRVTATRHKEELEGTLRYYSTDYANPYARPISQPDEFDGQRARDEAGARLRYINSGKRLTVRALVDLWVPPSTFKDASPAGHVQPKLDTYVRTEVRTSDEIRLGLWLRYQDKDLQASGHDQCFEVSTLTSETGDPIPCQGRQLTTILRGHYLPRRDLQFTMMLEHQLLDDRTLSKTAFRQDLAAWMIALYHPSDDLRIRARVRYLNEAIEKDDYLETSISGILDARFRVRHHDTLGLRVDTKFWLDNRMSTMARDPNPELQLWLSYEARL